jgi:endogenous inhibitor of DNA gyrase (YacG/DUF329 family)
MPNQYSPSTRVPRVCEQCGNAFTVEPNQARQGRGRFCSKRCRDIAQTPPLAGRFWAKVDRSGGPDACWPWTAARFHFGHGAFWLAGHQIHAHRIAWELTHGPIPEGDPDNPPCVLHDCPDGDNPACCNPAHLWLGTKGQNTKDMVAKGRHARGEQHAHSRFTAAQVRSIRTRYAAGSVSQRALAREYRVSRPTIRSIVRRKSWRHV